MSWTFHEQMLYICLLALICECQSKILPTLMILVYLRKFQISPVSLHYLTHWGRMTHICVSKLTIIGSDNGLSPDRRQAIIWTNAGILLNWPLGTNFSEMLSAIHRFSFKKTHLKMSSWKWRPFGLGPNVLSHAYPLCDGYPGKTTSVYWNGSLIQMNNILVKFRNYTWDPLY